MDNKVFRICYTKLIALQDMLWHLIHKNNVIENTISIFGTPRSGTTWIMDILLNALSNYWPIFEPLDPRQSRIRRMLMELTSSDEAISIYFLYSYYKEDNAILYKFFSALFSGSLINSSIVMPRQYFIKRWKRLIRSNNLLIKFIRANKLLPWLQYRFKLRGIILVIRHPCAVIASRMRLGWYPKEDYIRSPKFKKLLIRAITNIKEPLIRCEKLEYLINKMKKPEEFLAFNWALDYLIPLSYRDKPWFHVYILPYECALINPQHEFEQLFKYLRIKLNQKYFYHKDIFFPSPTTFNHTLRIIKPHQQLTKWRKILTSAQIKTIYSVLSYFGIESYEKILETLGYADYYPLLKEHGII